MTLSSAYLVVYLLSGNVLPVEAQQRKIETIDIDGRKNPELVPEWVVWRRALQILRTLKRDELPNQIIKPATDADVTLIRGEAERSALTEQTCNGRLLKAREPLQQLEQSGAPKDKRLATAGKIATEMWDIELECRWETIKARDRLLEKLTSDTSIGLRTFVETVKTGISVTISKSGLERFRQPQ